MDTVDTTFKNSLGLTGSDQTTPERRVKFIHPVDGEAGSGEGVIEERRGKVLIIATEEGKVVVPTNLVYDGQEHIPPLNEKTLTVQAAARIAIPYLVGQRSVPKNPNEYLSFEDYQINDYHAEEYRQARQLLIKNLPEGSWVKFTTPEGDYGILVGDYFWELDELHYKVFCKNWHEERPSLSVLKKEARLKILRNLIPFLLSFAGLTASCGLFIWTGRMEFMVLVVAASVFLVKEAIS